jgi:hypothetical protein
VLGEALEAARSIDNSEARVQALAGVAQRLPAEEALAIARGIDNAEARARALAEVAQRLPAEQQPSVLSEALVVARGINYAWGRAQALAEVARRLVLRRPTDLSLHQWIDTIRVLAMRTRSDFVVDFDAILPLLRFLGGKAVIRSLRRSVSSVGAWWP